MDVLGTPTSFIRSVLRLPVTPGVFDGVSAQIDGPVGGSSGKLHTKPHRSRAGHLWPSLWDVLSWWGARFAPQWPAGLGPEKERPGLLLPQQPDEVHNARRRPADVFLPSFHGRPTALDFAITAPQRLDVLGAAGITLAASAYTEHKRRHFGYC